MLAYVRRHHIGLIALFVALGGTSYAATRPANNSVGSGQIQSGAVTATKIRDGAITAEKLSPELRTRLGLTRPSRPTPVTVPNKPIPVTGPPKWRDPGILTAISSAGQTIVDQKIVTVQVTASWVPTGLSITAGQHLWTDTRNDGSWSGNPQFFPFSDANGLGPSVYKNCWKIDENVPVESLIGFIGGTPVNVSEGCQGGTTSPGFFEAGDTLKNYTPQTTGPVWLRTNDNTNHFSNVGRQIVKVIVTSS
ncbi:MAG TPA: hypothetical protein VK730_07015 [Solirubrobacteraceae bacterium]|nr:hypothetical protein [Solirubrobacteraceae bacterium]